MISLYGIAVIRRIISLSIHRLAYSRQEDFVPLPPPVRYFMVGIATAASVCFTSAWRHS